MERRKNLRVDVQLPISIHSMGLDAGHVSIKGHVMNVSEDGMGLAASHALVEGSSVGVSFELGQHTISSATIPGQIRWRKVLGAHNPSEYTYGVAIDSPIHKNSLKTMLSDLTVRQIEYMLEKSLPGPIKKDMQQGFLIKTSGQQELIKGLSFTPAFSMIDRFVMSTLQEGTKVQRMGIAMVGRQEEKRPISGDQGMLLSFCEQRMFQCLMLHGGLLFPHRTIDRIDNTRVYLRETVDVFSHELLRTMPQLFVTTVVQEEKSYALMMKATMYAEEICLASMEETKILFSPVLPS